MYPVHDMDYIYECSSVDETTGCWIWRLGFNNYGYGQMSKEHPEIKGRLAHRYSFFLYYGVIPDVVCHTCDNKKCVNPKHMYNGNAKTNAHDRIRSNTNSNGSRNGMSVLTENDVAQIRIMYRENTYSVKAMAEMFGVSETNIRRVATGKTWKHSL